MSVLLYLLLISFTQLIIIILLIESRKRQEKHFKEIFNLYIEQGNDIYTDISCVQKSLLKIQNKQTNDFNNLKKMLYFKDKSFYYCKNCSFLHNDIPF